jgi:hypothetical protein
LILHGLKGKKVLLHEEHAQRERDERKLKAEGGGSREKKRERRGEEGQGGRVK